MRGLDGWACARKRLIDAKRARDEVRKLGEHMKIQLQFKDPDVIWEIIRAKHPMPEDEDDISPRMEKEREMFSDLYFEYGDYGRIEIDTETLNARLVPRHEWSR